MISHKHKYIFVHIPKCGGSSIELALLEAEGVDCSGIDEINQLPEAVLKEYFMQNNLSSEPQHYTLGEYPEYFQKEYYCFTIIRNPWEIWLSEYHYRLGNSPEVSFEKFIHEAPALEYHLRKQIDFINQNMDYVGRMEDIDSDFTEICNMIGISAQLQHKNKGPHMEHYGEYYNEGIMRLIDSHNIKFGSTGRLDAKLMGYELEPFAGEQNKAGEEIYEKIIKNIFYINLDHRKDRKELVENELNELNWPFERFSAVKTKDGRLGCTASHINLLTLAASRELDYVVILEDDIYFRDKGLFLKQLKKCLDKLEDFDVLLIAGQVGPDDKRITEYAFKLSHCVTTTGYIVKKDYYKTLIANMQEGLLLLTQNPESNIYSVDKHWSKLQKKDKWYMVAPACAEQREGFSDVRDLYTDHRKLFSNTWEEKEHLINTEGYC